MFLHKSRCPLTFVVFGLILLSTRTICAQNPPSQIELNGFLLGQYKKVLDSTLGAPYEQITTDDGWVYGVYCLSEQCEGYMVFKFTSDDPEHIYSAQIAGNSETQMTPFLGLRLGDDKTKVIELLGRPSGVQPDAELNLELYLYDGRNYSVEIDDHGRVSSIQIFGYEGFREELEPVAADIEDVRRCLLVKDTNCLMGILAPDFEAYRGNQTYTFSAAARKELSDPNSPLVHLLLHDEASLRNVFAQEQQSGDAQLRLYKNRAPGCVYKFPDSKIIREIVYTFFAGKWRVWEIQFR